jgi:LuxR family transcriptional regulator, maltose regulon positive regulatory protein
MIVIMGRAGESGPAVGHRADSDAGRVVSRPALFERLGAPARVAVVSGPPGSGKTVLLQSWISEAGLADRAAWVPVGRDERDPRRFWLSASNALRRTAPGSALVQPLTAAPDLDGWTIVERLLADLALLDEPVWLVIDDVHELGQDALRQLELMIMRAPSELRFVVATRHDVQLGLHRLRLEGELTEIREPQLRFSVAEARELFAAAGVELSEQALTRLHERTEGWAAGLRLAALSLAGHPDPERFAREFSGSDRTVAEYLVAEVLDRQDKHVRLLLLRTSVLERVNGELADLLTGSDGGERTLQDLEDASAFVVSLDGARSWFRYHQMFADLLALQLRRTAPGEVSWLHQAAAGWFAQHGYPVEAIRHAQAATDWETAGRLLADHWPGLYLDGQAAAIHELMAGFPEGYVAAHAETAAVGAASELAQGSLEAAEWYLSLAEQGWASVPADRRNQVQMLLGIVRLLRARQRGNPSAVAEEAEQLRGLAEAPAAAQAATGLVDVGGEDLRALALISLGIAELFTAGFAAAERHIPQGMVLAQRIGRPYLEFTGLAHLALCGIYRSFENAMEHSRLAVEMARRHGWTDEPAAGVACVTIGVGLTWQGHLAEAEPWVERAERTLRAETAPAAALGIHYVRGLFELASGRPAEALTAFRAAEALVGSFVAPHYLALPTRGLLMQALARLGDTEHVEQALAQLDDQDRDRGEMCVATAVFKLAQHDPHAAITAIAPAADGSIQFVGLFPFSSWRLQAFLVEALAMDAAGDSAAAGRALERALDLAESSRALAVFLLHPAPDLLKRHAGQRTTHSALIAEILSLLAGSSHMTPSAGHRPLAEPLRDSELRVLRYLPTNLTAPEIARELYVSTNTVKTHMRNVYAKLGTHRRTETIARARDLGLLAPSASRR